MFLGAALAAFLLAAAVLCLRTYRAATEKSVRSMNDEYTRLKYNP